MWYLYKNFLPERKPKKRIDFVGNVIFDSLFYQAKKVENNTGEAFSTFKLLKEDNGHDVFLSLYQLSNVDFEESFEVIGEALNCVATEKNRFFSFTCKNPKDDGAV